MLKKAIGSTALRAGLPASVLALACVSAAGSAVAQSHYDGSWSVVISTHRGACQSGLRYGLQIVDGQVVSAAGGAADVRGSVNPGGAVRVSVQAGGQWANGSGHLGVATGGGVWRGQGNTGPCSGTWSARRMTSQVVADQMPGTPIYNYAPNYAPRAATVVADLTGASAQVLNLTGQFQCVKRCLAGPPAFAYLTQADTEMSLVNEAGLPSRGWIDYPGHIWVAAWNEGAFYSPDGMTIQFDSGSVWQRVVEVPIVAPVVRRHYRHYRTIASNG
jgi:hypothetical protein